MKKVNSINRSQILTLAHSIKRNENISFGDAQRKAWATMRAENIKGLLNSNIVVFEFRKESGEVRKAIGTLNTNLYHYESKGTSQAQNENIIKYWDIESNAFRCFRKDRFIKVIEVRAVQSFAIAA